MAEYNKLYEVPIHLEGYDPTYKGHQGQIKKAATLIKNAKRPLIIAGAGVLKSGAMDELKELAEKYHVSRNMFIACCLDEFFAIYRNYTSADFMDEYRELSVVIGKEVRIKQGNKIITGVVSTIDDLGRIVLTDGQIFSSGEVTKIRY